MVYKCTECGDSLWSDDCVTAYRGGGSFFVCPKCEASVNKTIGEVETEILTTLPVKGSLSLDTLTTKTNFKRDTIKEALRHLIDMGYLTTTPRWNYSLGTKGKEEKAKIE